MVGIIETVVGEGFSQITGDPIFSAILFLGFMGAFVMLQGTRLEGKLVVLIPTLFLAVVFSSLFLVVIVLGTSFITYLAITAMVNR